MSVEIVIVQKNADLKQVTFKDFDYENLYKKCGFRKSEGFEKRHSWAIKLGGENFYISVFSRNEGKANTENKYDMPPPIDKELYFGNVALVAHDDEEGEELRDLELEQWNKVYEKLFGGFEDLNATSLNDDLEEDELENIPDEYKTKTGYLKDGFVVDDSETDGSYNPADSDEEDEYSDDLDDGSELEFEEYEYQNED